MQLKLERLDLSTRTAVVDVMVYLAVPDGGMPCEPLSHWLDCQGRSSVGVGQAITKTSTQTLSEKERRRALKGQRVHFYLCSPHAAAGLPPRHLPILDTPTLMAIKLDDVYLGPGYRRLDQLHFYVSQLAPRSKTSFAVWRDIVEPRGWRGMLTYAPAKAMLLATQQETAKNELLFDDGTPASQEIWFPFSDFDGLFLVVNFDYVAATRSHDVDLKVVLTTEAPDGIVVDMRYAGLVTGLSAQTTPASGASEVKGIIYDVPKSRTLSWKTLDGSPKSRCVNMVQVVQIDDLEPPVDLTLFYVDVYQAGFMAASFTLADTCFGPALAEQLGILCRRTTV